MTTQWILVAQRAGAKLFQSTRAGTQLELLRDIPHLVGRLQDKDLGSDRPGRLFSNASHGTRSSTDSENTAHDHQAEVFAGELARILDKGRTLNEYDDLVLVAEPRFLGKLQASLTRLTAGKVSRRIEKELTKISDHELKLRLEDLLAA